MSLIPLSLIHAAAKKSSGSSFDPDQAMSVLGAPFMLLYLGGAMLFESSITKYQAMKEKCVAAAKRKANKKEYEELQATYPKLSEGKIGQVEVQVSEDGKTKSTIIHTKYGPLIKTETNNYSEKKVKGEDLQKTSVSFSGFIVTLDDNGKKILTYLDNIGKSISELRIINTMRDEAFLYNTSGTASTPDGVKEDFYGFEKVETTNHVAPAIPNTDKFNFIQTLEDQFEELLQKTHALNAEDSIQAQ